MGHMHEHPEDKSSKATKSKLRTTPVDHGFRPRESPPHAHHWVLDSVAALWPPEVNERHRLVAPVQMPRQCH